MRKKIAGILLGINITAGLLAGCGQKSATDAAAESAKTEKAGNGEEDLSDESGEKAQTEGAEANLESEESPESVGVLLSGENTKDALLDVQSFEKHIEEKNYNAIICNAAENAQTQLMQFQDLLDRGVTTIVVDPVDPYSFTEAFQTANEELETRLKLISFDTLIMDTDQLSYYVTFDQRAIGHQAAERMIKDFSLEKTEEEIEPLSIEFFMGSLDDVDALFFYNGMMEKLSPYLESGQLICKSGRLSFQEVGILGEDSRAVKKEFSNVLADFYAEEAPDIVVTGFDQAAYLIQEVLEENEVLPGTDVWPYITGVGCESEAVRDIAEGRIRFSVFTDRRKLAEKCVDLVDTCIKGESPKVDDYEQYDNGVKIIGTEICKGQVIDVDNYQVLIDNGYYEESEVEPLDMVTAPEEEADAELTPAEQTPDETPESVLDEANAEENAEEKVIKQVPKNKLL